MGAVDKWGNFYLATGAAAAALTALLFVAVSLRPGEIRRAPATLGRARGAFYALGTVMTTSLINLAPLTALGVGTAEALLCAAVIVVSSSLILAVRRAHLLRPNLPRIVTYFASLGLIEAAGIARAAGLSADFAQPLFAAAALVLMLVGLNNAWVLVLTHGDAE